MNLPRDRGTVGDELKIAVQANLLDLAREALNLHHTLEGRKFTNSYDVQAYRYDLERIETITKELDVDARRAQRYYRDGDDR